MSIQTELTRLTNAKADIKAAIDGKGVTVPDGTLLDGMAALIESIEAGGIDITEFGFSKAVFGTTTGSNSIIHNLGEYPKCVIFWSPDAWTYGDSMSSPQFYLKAGIGFVLTDPSGNTKVVEGFSEIRRSGIVANTFSAWEPPKDSYGRSGFDSRYFPSMSNPGVCINARSINAVNVDGMSGSGYSIKLYPGATYYWGVFA